ncbi:hypothetical protein [Streptomyces sp. CAU 1734]|uniref:hypothetical protein n=1 Tax=Streptomyces sp. CAU 1734 TaxID=3140360 RepID=UPI00326035D9
MTPRVLLPTGPGAVPDAIAAVIAAAAETAWAERPPAAPEPDAAYWTAVGHAVLPELRRAGWRITPPPPREENPI